MDIVYLLLCLVFMVVGLQLLRGKWLGILIGHRSATADQVKRAGMALAPGAIALGLSMFFFGFFDSQYWANIGNVIFVLSIVYIILVDVWLISRERRA
ncbi:hypothetical protein [Limosilactobacillus kribbianus]|uniref:hypothetical protein n=1 Tax=Limosilactobacillus kribbianus TaxID=2982695 RepID=UPI002263DEE5|nr:hypothetical protein [Limosilactobacillus kribbianus]